MTFPSEPNVRPSARPGGVNPSTPEDAGKRGRSALFAALVVILHTFLLGGFLVGAMVTGPRYDRVFRDFNLQLDESTKFVLATSRWLNDYWYAPAPFLFMGLLIDGAILFLLHRSPRTRRWSYVWAAAVVLLILLFSGCWGTALYWPYSKMLDGLSR